MLKEIANQYLLIWDLAKNDFKTKYAGSFLGIVWAFVQPVITIIVYWVVFQYGLKISMENTDIPYVLWFMGGMVPWLFFSDCLGNGSNCLKEYNYLVKKVLFPIQILPVVKLISAFLVHLVFLVFLMVVSIVYNMFFSIHIFELVYFVFCLCLYSCVCIFFSCAVVVFFKDFGQIISIVLQIGMWATPILWDFHRIPDQFLWIMECNPLFYIVEGYRSAFFGGGGIYPSAFRFWFFWIFIICALVGSLFMFRRLEKHFADVL